jgi:hypothetical protein
VPRRRTATQVIEETLPKCPGFSWCGKPYRRTTWHRYEGRVYHIQEANGVISAFWTRKGVARYLVLIAEGKLDSQQAYDRARGQHWAGHWYSDWSFDYDRR